MICLNMYKRQYHNEVSQLNRSDAKEYVDSRPKTVHWQINKDVIAKKKYDAVMNRVREKSKVRLQPRVIFHMPSYIFILLYSVT